MTSNLQGFLDGIVNAGGYPTQKKLRFHTEYMLGDVTGVKTALDIGGGAGILSLYLASLGVEKVICLEPEGDGAHDSITDRFRKYQSLVPAGDNVELLKLRFQDYDPGDLKFDLIVSANAINHLEEEACVDLKENPASYAIYMNHFKNLFEMLNSGGRIVMSDCSRYNFFQAIRVKNPLMPSIEWDKHQSPYQWVKMFQEAGFVKPKIQWTTPNSFGLPGRVLFGNALANYFTLGHFKFTLYKP